MNGTIERAGATRLEVLSLTAIGMLALQLAIAFQRQPRDVLPARDRDYVRYFHAHQLFRCGPEELGECQLNDLDRWCRCLPLFNRHNISGVQSLTDEECLFVVEVLDDLCPDMEPFPGFRRIHESCRASLGRRQAIASNRESPSHGPSVLLE